MDDRTALLNSIQLGEGWVLVVESDKDIITTDRITIGGVTYEVRGVKLSTLGSIAIKECQLVKKKA